MTVRNTASGGTEYDPDDFFGDESAQATVEYAILAAILIVLAYEALTLIREILAVSFRKTAGIRSGIPGAYP